MLIFCFSFVTLASFFLFLCQLTQSNFKSGFNFLKNGKWIKLLKMKRWKEDFCKCSLLLNEICNYWFFLLLFVFFSFVSASRFIRNNLLFAFLLLLFSWSKFMRGSERDSHEISGTTLVHNLFGSHSIFFWISSQHSAMFPCNNLSGLRTQFRFHSRRLNLKLNFTFVIDENLTNIISSDIEGFLMTFQISSDT